MFIITNAKTKICIEIVKSSNIKESVKNSDSRQNQIRLLVNKGNFSTTYIKSATKSRMFCEFRAGVRNLSYPLKFSRNSNMTLILRFLTISWTQTTYKSKSSFNCFKNKLRLWVCYFWTVLFKLLFNSWKSKLVQK